MSVTDEAAWAALPETGFLTDYVRYCSGRTDAPTAYHILGGLALLGQLSRMEVRMGARKVRPNLFMLMIGDSTRSRKGVSIELCKEILRAAKPLAVQEEPASIQALYEATRVHKHSLLVYEEFGSFLSRSETGPLMAMKTSFNKLYDGDPLGNAKAADIRNRNAPSTGVENHCVSVVAGSAPNYLERHTESVDWTDGFFARFLCITGDRSRLLALPRDDKEERARLITWFSNVYKAFHHKETIEVGKLDAAAEAGDITKHYNNKRDKEEAAQLNYNAMLQIHFKEMTPQAEELYIAWQAETERRAGSARFTASIARSPMMVMKISLLMAYQNQWWNITQGKEWCIGIPEMEAAIQIVELHIKSIFDLGKIISEDEWMAKRKTVLKTMHHEIPVSSAQIIAKARMSKRDVETVLQSLEHEEAVQKVAPPDDMDNPRGRALSWYVSILVADENYTPPELENPEQHMTSTRSQPFGIHKDHMFSAKLQSGTKTSSSVSKVEIPLAKSRSSSTYTPEDDVDVPD